MQAPHDLPNLVCPSSAQLRAEGSLVVGLHTGMSVPLVLYPSCSPGLSIPTLAWPGPAQPCRGGGRGCDTPGTSQLHVAAAPARDSRGVSASTRGVLLPRLFVTERPHALHPCAVPGGPWSSRAQRAGDPAGPSSSWGHGRPPFELGTLRASLPRATSSQITQTQQLLSKPCKVEPVGREGAVGRHAAGTAHVPGEGKEAPGEAGQEDPNPTLGMTRWLPRAPALWGNKAFLGCSFSIFL